MRRSSSPHDANPSGPDTQTLLEPGDDHPVQTVLLREIGADTFLKRYLSDDVRERERLLQLRLVLTDLKGVHTGMLAALMFAVAALGQTPGEGLAALLKPWLWLLLMEAGFVYAVLLHRRYRRSQSNDDLRRTGRRLMGFAVYCGFTWGASAWMLLPGRTLEFEALVITGMGLVMVGTAGAQSMYRPLLRAFLVPVTVVFTVGVFRLGGPFHWLLGGGVLLLAITIMAVTKVQEDAVKAAIRLGFESERLLAERIEQQAITARALVEAQRANAGKNTFLAAAGHDLGQPMNALSLYLGHLKRSNRDASLHEALQGAGMALDAMHDLLDSVIEASRLMMGAVQPELRDFPIGRVLARLDAQLRPLAAQKGLTLEWQDQGQWVHSDELLLERILRNLALNAIRYTERGGVLIRCRTQEEMLSVQVWDSGIGIAPAEQARIFDSFYQVGQVARGPHKGLGLGLALVRQMCELLGYRLRLRSVPGRGSVFKVEVPLAEEAQRAATVTPP